MFDIRQSGRPELFRTYVIDDPRGFGVCVEVGQDFAFCTCRDFADADFTNERWQAPQRYYGATYDHGCAHVDAVILTVGYTPNCDHQEPEPVDVSESALTRAFQAGLRLGFELWV